MTDDPASPERTVVVIDFDDRHDPHLRKQAARRRAAYADLDWPVVGRRGVSTRTPEARP